MYINNGILLILAVSVLLTFVATPFVKVIARRIGAVDVPRDDRRMHRRPIPRLGGLAMFYGFVVSVLVFIQIEPQLIGILIGSVIMVTMGIFDDRKPLPAKLKFPLQIVAACIPVICGLSIKFLTLPIIGRINIATPFSQIISVLWIVGITNAVNLIDGLDGLAAGVSSIASLSILFISVIMGNMEAALISAALVGCCLGFLPFNTNPAKMFMGDTGSNFLGFVLGCITILGAFKSYALIAFVIPFFVLALPIFDTAFAILRRMYNHKPIMEADRGHMHHRLIDIGFNQKQTVIILYSASMLLGLSAIVIAARGPLKGALFIIAILPVAVQALSFMYKRGQELREEEQKMREEENNKQD